MNASPPLRFLVLPLLAPIACGTFACKSASEHEDPTPSPSGPTPEASRIDSDVRWLADDEREGRRAGTAGELAAARWIAQRMGRLGLEPAGEDGWLQPFEVPLPPRDGGGSSVAVGVPQKRGTVFSLINEPGQLVPLFCSEGGQANGEVAFGGYGITAPELGWDDYGGRDLEGKIALVVRGTPPDALLPDDASSGEAENPHGAPVASSGWGNAGSIFHKVMEAKRRGAVAVLIASHPSSDEPLLAFDAGRTAEAHVPALMVEESLAEDLVPGYAVLVERIDSGEDVDRSEISHRMARVTADVVRETGIANNVLGRIPGERSGRTVVVGAHFDHLGRGGPGSLERDSTGEIHNGADDNASGTAVALEVARCLMEGEGPEGDVLIALWSGEELGLLGSEYWAQHPTVPLEDLYANLNLDMVGRAGDGKLAVLGAGTAGGFALWLEQSGPACDLELDVSLSGQGVGGSDHQTFLKREIPALHLFSGVHPDYHRPSDDPDGVEVEGARRVAELCLALIQRIQGVPELVYVEPEGGEAPSQRGGFRTRFGSIPEYSYDGKGLLLAGTSAGGPAERAGLLKGDILMRIGDIDIEGMGEFMYALNAHKPGDVVVVKYLRDGEEEETRVTLEGTAVE